MRQATEKELLTRKAFHLLREFVGVADAEEKDAVLERIAGNLFYVEVLLQELLRLRRGR